MNALAHHPEWLHCRSHSHRNPQDPFPVVYLIQENMANRTKKHFYLLPLKLLWLAYLDEEEEWFIQEVLVKLFKINNLWQLQYILYLFISCLKHALVWHTELEIHQHCMSLYNITYLIRSFKFWPVIKQLYCTWCRGKIGVHNIFVNPELRWKPTSVKTIFSDLKPKPLYQARESPTSNHLFVYT